ncbi:hypothetical protein K439DRAFT_1647174 [Ramaria rubella]|nr:hypothetical protein K439DRAFT_1647174 [Ramaria rubella]
MSVEVRCGKDSQTSHVPPACLPTLTPPLFAPTITPKNNPSGKNGIDNGTWPSNDILKSSLLQYAREVRRLANEHGLYIRYQLNQKFNIPSVRRGPQSEHAAQLILNEVAADTNQLNGAGHIKMALATKGHLIPRSIVRQVILDNDPDGVDACYPGQKRIKQTQLSSIGVFDEVCCDGHNKANAQALQLGPWSGAILHMVVVPNDHLATTIGHPGDNLTPIDSMSATPLWITVDKGSETGEMFAMQTSLRCKYAPNVCEETYPPFVALKSVHNTTIKGIWHWLRKTAECNFIDEVRRGHTEGVFNLNNELHVALFNWIWLPICQSVLDEFMTYWNNHRVRSQKNKLMPSGATPRDIFTSPQAYGGERYSIPRTQEAIDALRAELLLSRQSALQFVDEEFANHACQVWHQLGSPPCSVFSSGWEIFTKMLSIWPEFETNKSV